MQQTFDIAYSILFISTFVFVGGYILFKLYHWCYKNKIKRYEQQNRLRDELTKH